MLSEPRPIRAFAFDLDETLVDCSRQHEVATRHLLQETGVPVERVRAAFADTTGGRTRDIVSAMRDVGDMAHDLDDLLRIRAAAFREALREDSPLLLPGAEQVLQECAKLGPVALVTSGHEADVAATLEAAGIRDLFDELVTGECVQYAKPHPEPYVLAAERLDLSTRDLLVFEDSERGVRSALHAGCRVVAVPRDGTTRRHQVADAHLLLRSLEAASPVDALVRRLGGIL